MLRLIKFHFFNIINLGLAVIALGLYLVSFRSQKLSLYAFGLCTMGFGLWEFPFAASLFFTKIFLVLLLTNYFAILFLLLYNIFTIIITNYIYFF